MIKVTEREKAHQERIVISDPQTPTEFPTWAQSSLTHWIKKEGMQFDRIFHIIAASYDWIYMSKYPIKSVFKEQIFTLISNFYRTFFPPYLT